MRNINKINKILKSRLIPDDPYLFESLYPEAFDFLVRYYSHILTESYDYELALLDEGIMKAVRDSAHNFAVKHPKITDAAKNTALRTAYHGLKGTTFIARNAGNLAGGIAKGAANLTQWAANKTGEVGGTIAKAVTEPVKAFGSAAQFTTNTLFNPARSEMQDKVADQLKMNKDMIHRRYGDNRKKEKMATKIAELNAWLATYEDPRGYRGATASTYGNVQKKVKMLEDKFKEVYGEYPRYSGIDYSKSDNTIFGPYDRGASIRF